MGNLIDAIIKRLQAGPQYFPPDQLADQPERFISFPSLSVKRYLPSPRTRYPIPRQSLSKT